MPAVPPSRDWSAMRWSDIDPVETARWIAVLPLAAIEQHGPHLPVGTDFFIAHAYLARLRAVLPDDLPVAFLPVQPIGISTEHTAFPGTLTLPADLAIKSWSAIGDGVARAGVKKLLLITSHGGNSAAMTLVAQDLRARHGMLAVTTSWSRFMPSGLLPDDEIRHGVHGGATETAVMLARHPDLVRSDAIADFTPSTIAMERSFTTLSTQRPAPMAWQAEDLHPSGAAGNATLASAEIGERLLDHGARAVVTLLQDMSRFDMTRLANAPELP